MRDERRTTLGEFCRSGGGDIQTGPFGSQLHASDYVPSGIPSVMPQNIGDNVIDSQGIAQVSEVDATRLSKYRLKAGDIIYSRRGDVEKRSLVRAENEGWLCGTGCLRVRLGPTTTGNATFLSYLFGTDEVRSWIVRHAVGATMPNLNTSILSALPLVLPPSLTQVAVAGVLGALDDKIAANTRLTESIEVLASTIFDSTVDEPRCEPLVNLARFVNGKAFTKEATGTGRVVIRIAELNSGIGVSTVRNDLEVAEDHVARPGDLLFAWSGSLTVSRWYRPEGIINQHIFKVMPRDGFPLWLVHQVLLRKLAEFRAIAADKATTMGHIQRRHLEESVTIPSSESIARMHNLMEGLWLRALAAEEESLVLATLRDTLLPELMSGRLRVKDAEQQVGEVL